VAREFPAAARPKPKLSHPPRESANSELLNAVDVSIEPAIESFGSTIARIMEQMTPWGVLCQWRNSLV
jgi:hypothetical protein